MRILKYIPTAAAGWRRMIAYVIEVQKDGRIFTLLGTGMRPKTTVLFTGNGE